jgi:hypothetical protein
MLEIMQKKIKEDDELYLLKKASFTLGGEWRGLLKTTKQPKI